MSTKNYRNSGKTRALLNLLSDMAAIVDAKGCFLMVNDVFEEVTGLNRKELIGQPFLNVSLLTAESKAILLENLKKRMQGAPVELYDVSFTDKAGKTRQVEVKGKKVSYAGQPANLVVFHDVTRRRENEKRLKQYAEHMEELVEEKVREIQDSKEKLTGIFESTPDPIAISSLDAKIIDCNPAALKTFGYSTKSEIVGRSVFDFFAEKERARAAESLTPERMNVTNAEYVFQTKNGREFLGELSSNAVLHSSGAIAFFVSTIKDITERKNNEAKLRLSEEQFRQLFSNMPSGVAVYEAVDNGKDFVFKDFNHAAETIEKTSRENVLGKCVTQVFPGVESFGLFKIFQRVWRSGQPEYYPAAIYKDNEDPGTWRENWVYKLPNGYIVATYRDITEQKNAEFALARSEEKFKVYIESSPVAVFVANPEGKYEYVNDAACRLLGYSKAELLEMSIPQVAFKQDNQKDMSNFVKVKETGRSLRETTLKAKDGLPVYVILNSVKLPDGKLMAFCENITERKEKENILRESEERFKQVAESAEEWIWEVDAHGTFIYSSPMVEKILGNKPEEIIGKKRFYDSLHSEDREYFRKVVLSVFDKKQIFHGFVSRNMHRNGETVWLSTSGSPMFDKQGKLVGYRGTCTDITELKKRETELKAERHKLETMTQSIGAGFVAVSKDYHILWANKFIRDYKGDVEGKFCYATLNDLSNVCPDCGVKKIFEDGVNFDAHEYSSIDVHGKPYWVEIIATPIKDEAGNVVSAVEVAVNITEKKSLQDELAQYSMKLEKLVEDRTEQLKEAQQRLVKSERLAAIGELAGMVGHDLRNPLTGIKNAAYFLKKKGAEISEAQAKTMLEIIEKGVDHSDKIIRDLLDYAREMHLELQEISVHELLDEALAMISIPERIRIQKNIPEALSMKVDSNKIERVFINLVKNAIDAMPKGGTIAISCQQRNGDSEVSFSDTGSGIPEDVLPKLFSPLFTTKAKGMGFGLAICKRFIEAHGGTLTVETEVGKGTTFTMILPIEPKLEIGGENVWINLPESLSLTTTKA